MAFTVRNAQRGYWASDPVLVLEPGRTVGGAGPARTRLVVMMFSRSGSQRPDNVQMADGRAAWLKWTVGTGMAIASIRLLGIRLLYHREVTRV